MSSDLSSSFPRTSRVIQNGIEHGLNMGMQLYVSVNLEPVLHVAVGENQPGIPLTTDTRMLWLSAGKPITATATLQAIEKRQLSLDTPIVTILPEFTGPGTENITIWNLLTHTAGLKPILTGFPDHSWDDIVKKICTAGLKRDQSPGAEIGYDPGRTWFLLGEILQRLEKRSIAEIVRQDVLEPLGMSNTWLAMPEAEFDAHPELIGISYTSKGGLLTPTRGHHREGVTKPAPGSNMRGPIRELGWFYESLLRQGMTPGGSTLLRPETVEEMTSRQREAKLDTSFQRVIDFGLGVIINSRKYGGGTVPYGYGQFASDATFGHGGSQSSIGFADPVHKVVVAAIANGMPGDEQHNLRFHNLLTAIYEDLGIA